MNVQSLDEYKTIIHLLKKKYTVDCEPRFLYRGHSNHVNYKLLPGVFRPKIKGNCIIRPCNQDEKGIIKEYRDISSRGLNGNKELIEIGQHYGVPTRLMDLTEDEFVALYFACSEETKSFPSVWIINETNYSRWFFSRELSVNEGLSPTEIVNKVLSDEWDDRDNIHNDINKYVIDPFIYKPDWIDQRQINQKSWFMLWGARQDEFDDITNSDKCNVPISLDNSVGISDKSILGVITIDPNYQKSILFELEKDYSRKYIYPTDDDPEAKQVRDNNTNDNNTQYVKNDYGSVKLVLNKVHPSRQDWKEE